MMDILVILGEIAFGRAGTSRRARLLARLVFGLLGTVLGVAGALHVALTRTTRNTLMLASMVALFVFLACFCLFNVALARSWRWPGRLFVLSFVALFVSRLIWGS